MAYLPNKERLRKKTTAILFLAAALCQPFNLDVVTAQEKEPINIGFYEWCPYTCNPEEREGKKGYLVDIISTIYEGNKYHLHFKFMPYSRILNETLEGNIHIIAGVTKDEALSQKIPLIVPKKNQGYYRGGYFKVIKPKDPYSGYDSLVELDHITIIKGYVYNSPEFFKIQELHPDKIYRITGKDIYRRMLDLINMGRIDVILEDIKAANSYIKFYGFEDTIQYWGGKTMDESIFIAFSPSPTRKELTKSLLQQFEHGFDRMIESGEMGEILASYDIDPREFNFVDITERPK